MRQSRPILPVREYEKMIVGRLDAQYVGTDNCVAKCHKHDKITQDFRHSVHGEQIRPDDGLPLVNCESCHGPGSLAIASLEDDPDVNDRLNKKCDTSTFLDIMNLPPQAQSLICMKCHTAASIPMLSHWNASTHALNNVSCFDCHKLHKGPLQKVRREEVSELCFGCHPEVRTECNLFSHHPLREKKMSCVDCHEPHGSTQEKLLKGNTQKEICTRCHMEKQGPFAYEHGDVTENCSNCHTPHGSVNNNLLNAAMPFLCLQCHGGHLDANTPGETGRKQLFLNRCTDCHSQVHGSDIPAPAKAGTGTLRQ
jgi:DmsE family decaheme c-type cytochrome